ncbi:MAG: L-ascorbate metabolism protein UlaG (beta-lactamase superfamily) [Flavobacteriales bacterium]|jgi:L-ascorbate metabolism protein UlaG (beta-lactamase superfamily)
MSYVILFLFIVFLLFLAFFYLNPQFGGTVTSTRKSSYSKSKNWDGKQFTNLVGTAMDVSLKTMPKLLKAQFTDREERSPKLPIPILPFDEGSFELETNKPKFIWYGHSVLLLQMNGKNILIDPMLGPDAAPIAPFPSKRFSENSLDVIDQLPQIDLLLMTHDHYDHLDLASMRKLKDKVSHIYCSLGVRRHLDRWGFKSHTIREFDWWEDTDFHGIAITFTPSRHFSGRGLSDRAKCLWGGWVFKSKEHRIYWSGDGGYGDHFKEVGERLGPFHWTFMENGQYNKLWHQIHLYPEEAVQAAIDAKSNKVIAVHWAGFALALHPWKECIERFVIEAKKQHLSVCTPKIGEVVHWDLEPINAHWWEQLD